MQGGMYGGIIHCFSYSREIAAEYLKMGLYLGIGGVVTFKNAKKLKETVQYAPLSQLVLETDCPYMSPEPNRGKRNSSLNLPYVAQAIAELKGITAEEVIDVTRQSFFEGIKFAKAGNHLYEISAAIGAYAEKFGYGVVRDLVGHGIGTSLHETLKFRISVRDEED